MTVNQIKVGDILIRQNDHLGRDDSRLKVVKKMRGVKTYFETEDVQYHSMSRQYATSLSAQGYNQIERNGVVIGTFCAKYW